MRCEEQGEEYAKFRLGEQVRAGMLLGSVSGFLHSSHRLGLGVIGRAIRRQYGEPHALHKLEVTNANSKNVLGGVAGVARQTDSDSGTSQVASSRHRQLDSSRLVAEGESGGWSSAVLEWRRMHCKEV